MFPDRRTLATLLATGLAGAALLAPGAAAGAGPVTIAIEAGAPEVVFHDLAGDGWSAGDVVTYTGAFVADDGRSGRVSGELHAVAMPGDDSVAHHHAGLGLFDFGDGDSIVVAGASPMADPEGAVAAGAETVGAIVGGTGAYVGARGEIRTTGTADGSVRHLLSLAMDPATTETVTVGIPVAANVLTQLVGPEGYGVGDLRSWHSAALTEDGDPASVYGIQHVTRSLSGDGREAEVFGTVIVALNETDRIVGIAASPVVVEGESARAVPPFVNAVIGGTGAFAGVSGSYAFSRSDDGVMSLALSLTRPETALPERTLTIHSALVPEAVEVDAGAAGDSRGDSYVWETPFTAEDGPGGMIRGYVATLDVPSGDDPGTEVAGLSVLTFEDGSTVVVADFHVEDVAPEVIIIPEVRRAVIGGTGAYAGVAGELVTVLGADGDLVHTLTLRG